MYYFLIKKKHLLPHIRGNKRGSKISVEVLGTYFFDEF